MRARQLLVTTQHTVAPSIAAQVLAVGTIVLALATVVSLLQLHLLDTGFNPVRDAVSQYGASVWRLRYQIAAMTLGSAALLLAIGLGLVIRPDPGNVIALLAVFCLARWTIPWFPTNLPGQPRTQTGAIHLLLAAAAFITLPWAAVAFAGAIANNPSWSDIHGVLAVLGWLAVIAAVLTAFTLRSPQLRPYFGAVERSLYVAMITWLVVTAAWLIHASA